MGSHQHVAMATLEHLIKQVNDLSLPVIVEMYLGLIQKNECLSRPKQRKQAHSP
jgi:phosphopentomutase